MTADEARRAGFQPTAELRWHTLSSRRVRLEQLWLLPNLSERITEWIEVPTWPPLADVSAKRAS